MSRIPSPPGDQQILSAQQPEVLRIAAILHRGRSGLRDYHAVGEQMRQLAENSQVAWRGSKWRERVAELVGCSPSTLTKALQFRLAYEEEDLAELEKMGVGWSQLTIGLAVRDRQQRHQLLRLAQQQKWSDRDLQRQIQSLEGRHRGGGRPRRKYRSQGLQADLTELVQLTQLWLAFATEVWVQYQHQPPTQAYLATLSESARTTLTNLLTEAQQGILQMECSSRLFQAGLRQLEENLRELCPEKAR